MFVKLKQLRHQKKYTAKVMSEKLGISKPFYHQIENQKRRLTYEMAIKISEIFKVRPDTVFYEDFTKNKEQ